MTVRHTITFIGRVQGVGFRATTRSLADGFSVTGFVRNQADRSVLCVVEGDAGEIDRFVSAVKRAMASCVDKTDVQSSPATGEFSGFAIRR